MMQKWAEVNSDSVSAVGAPGLGFGSLLTDLDCVGTRVWGEKPREGSCKKGRIYFLERILPQHCKAQPAHSTHHQSILLVDLSYVLDGSTVQKLESMYFRKKHKHDPLCMTSFKFFFEAFLIEINSFFLTFPYCFWDCHIFEVLM